MKWPRRLGFKLYAFLFFFLALANGLSLIHPQTDIYVYYHTMIAFHPASALHYHLALWSGLLTVLSLIPLILYASLSPQGGRLFFLTLFWARIVFDLAGHNYEWQFFKSAFLSEPVAALAGLALFIAILFPSYRAHFLYVFKTGPSQ